MSTKISFNQNGLRIIDDHPWAPVALRTYKHIIAKGRTIWSDKRRYEAWDSII